MTKFVADLTPEKKRFMDALQKLEDLEVAVGFQGDEAYEDGTSIAQVAAYSEFGTSDIPERPFMRQSFENHQPELQAMCEEALATVANGGSPEDALNKIGVLARGLIQEEIVNGGFAPNAPSTIKKKGSSQPLIDTGTMRQSVNYRIRRRGADQ